MVWFLVITIPVKEVLIFFIFVFMVSCILNYAVLNFSPFCSYEMLSLEEQLEIAQQIGTTRFQILSNFSDFSLGTSFL